MQSYYILRSWFRYSQKPVDGSDENDVFSRKTHRREDHEHRNESRARHARGANTGKRRRQTDGYDVTNAQGNVVDLSNKDGGDCFVQSCAVHVDGGTDRKDETSDALVNTEVFFETTERDRKCRNTEIKSWNISCVCWYCCCVCSFSFQPRWYGGRSDTSLYHSAQEFERVSSSHHEIDKRQSDESVEADANDYCDHVPAERRRCTVQIVHAQNLRRD